MAVRIFGKIPDEVQMSFNRKKMPLTLKSQYSKAIEWINILQSRKTDKIFL